MADDCRAHSAGKNIIIGSVKWKIKKTKEYFDAHVGDSSEPKFIPHF